MKGFRFRGVTAVLVAIAATAGLTLTASAATAATARPATVAAAVAPATSCVGSVAATSGGGLAEQEFWWTKESTTSICIGSVIFTETYTQQTGLDQRVRIWEEPENFLVAAYWDGGTITSTGIRFVNEIRTVQPAPEGKVMVCSAVTNGYGSNDVVGGIPVICQTVG